MHQLPPPSFARRRASILEALPDRSALLLPTATEQPRNGDTHYPFRPDSDFYYVTGFPEPCAWALLRKVDNSTSYTLFVQPRDPAREVWTGLRAGVDGARGDYGADQAFDISELDERLKQALEPVDNLYFAFGRHAAEEQRLSGVLTAVRTGRKSGLGPVSITDPGTLLAEMRLHKTPDEIELMRVGARITDEAHRLSMAQVRPGMYEYEIEALLQYTFRRHGAWGWAYPCIVGGGPNACVLHYIENNSIFREGDLMLIDAGAEIDGYATDVTRTSPVSGRFSDAQKDLYSVVLSVQEEAIQATKPGATIDDIHAEVVRQLSDGMIQLGLLQGSVDAVIETQAFRRYYMHRTSHWLGLDVHDVGRYHDPTGPARDLEPGMVITIEPGLYIPPNDEQAPAAFRGMGIRIEDDILVTEDGCENLTAAIPKTIDDIESLRER